MKNYLTSLCILFALSAHGQISNGLLVNYNFSNDLTDSSGNGFDASGSVDISFGEDRFGNPNAATYYNGLTSWVTMAEDPALQPAFPFSISVWVNHLALQTEDGGANGIINTCFVANNYHGAWLNTSTDGDVIGIGYGDGSGCTGPPCRNSRAVTGLDLVGSGWNHIVGIWDSPTQMSIYLNGCLMPTSSSGSGELEIAYDSGVPGAIGKTDSNSFPGFPDNHFDGAIDDIYFWDRAISEEEIDTLFANFYPAESYAVEYTGCSADGYSVEVNGTIYDETNPTGVEMIAGLTNCDTIVTVNLEFNSISETLLMDDLCAGDSTEYIVNGTVYNEANPSGTEMMTSSAGCDSTVIVDLQFSAPAINEEINSTLCTGESLTVNGVVYDESNPTGMSTLAGSSGCDSIAYNVNLSFEIAVTGEESYSGCSGDGYSVEVNGVTYDENNPEGEQALSSGSGCDSIVSINLSFAEKTIVEEFYSFCDGESVTVNGETYNSSGAFMQSFTDDNDCPADLIINVETETCEECPSTDNNINVNIEVSKLNTGEFQINIFNKEENFLSKTVNATELIDVFSVYTIARQAIHIDYQMTRQILRERLENSTPRNAAQMQYGYIPEALNSEYSSLKKQMDQRSLELDYLSLMDNLNNLATSKTMLFK